MIFDAHTHLPKDSGAARDANYTPYCVTNPEPTAYMLANTGGAIAPRTLRSAISVSTPEDARRAFALREKNPNIAVTVGIHPWHADTVTLAELAEFLPQADAIGEIGLDSVWCTVSHEAQLAAFIAQLDLACKPENASAKQNAVLHTKGCEYEIAEITAQYELTYLIHWYSHGELPAEFRRENYLFSLGCDIAINPAVQRIAAEIPLNRLMLETDGDSAIEWAHAKRIEPLQMLNEIAVVAAGIRGITPAELISATTANAINFYRQKK